ncbi:DUF2007 domain-containing protein [Ancylobacter sonchi]|uniref:putative signal transducing protein n=1 Tax=Ancylobacter TaxID=99 RepID=UPI001BD45EF1|nr:MULTISPECIES: DUF2007 domain-containing protein [Ancylobacter]MBS7533611.1 DUF2007 domain-containing protein [Ancylobacter sonchi]MCB4767469.1 DUF2007 domain-containing protein [Ancylobacter sp. Lp-2]
MREIMRTNDPVLISAVEALLAAEGIGHLVLDRHMSILEGSLGVIPRRLLVEDDAANRARRLLVAAGLGRELVPE